MKEKEKWTPHIIAATALVVFIVLGLASASSSNTQKEPPKPPVEMVYDPDVPENQTATLLISTGYKVGHFNGKQLNPIWEEPSGVGTYVRIPAGSHRIMFDLHFGFGLDDVKNVDLDFNAIAGRTYVLVYHVVSTIHGNNRVTDTLLFKIYEISERREPEPDEQLLFIKHESNGGISSIIVLDKGTDEERLIISSVLPSDDRRVIVSKGEHTIDVQASPSKMAGQYEPKGEQPRVFTASSEPVRYFLETKSTGSGKNRKTTYTLTMQ